MIVRDVVIWLRVREAAPPVKNPLTCRVVKTRFQRDLPMIELETAQGELLWVPLANIAWVEMGPAHEIS